MGYQLAGFKAVMVAFEKGPPWIFLSLLKLLSLKKLCSTTKISSYNIFFCDSVSELNKMFLIPEDYERFFL